GALLSGLWELPTSRECEDVAAFAARVGESLGAGVRLAPEPTRAFRHSITHRRIAVHVHEASSDAAAAREAGDGLPSGAAEDLREFGVSSMTKKALAAGDVPPRGGRRASAATIAP